MIPRVAIDGYFASGKSSVAVLVAAGLGASLVRPFGDDDARELFGYVDRGEFEHLDVRGREILAAAEARAGEGPVVFDRHWFSILAYLPPALHAGWSAPPRTYVCWAGLDTTLRRLAARVVHEADAAVHAPHVLAYRTLAERLGVPLIDTSGRTAEESAALVLDDLARPQRH